MNKLILYLSVICILCISQSFAQRVLTLQESKQLAFVNNSKSKNSKLETEASRQVKKQAFTNYFPNVSAGGLTFGAQKNLMEIKTSGGNLPVYDGNPANIMSATQFAYMPGGEMGLLKKGTIGFVNAVQPVFAGGRIVNGNKLASLGEEVSIELQKLTANEVQLKTEEQYWLIVSLEEKQKTLGKYEELLNNLMGQVTDAFKSGLVMENDVLKVKLKQSEVLLNKSKLENGNKIALMVFCQYIGIPYDSTIQLRDDLTVKNIPQSFYVDHQEAVKNRVEYDLLKKSVIAEKLQTNMKMGEYLPQAAIGINGTYMKLDESDSRTIGMVFGTVSVPISGWWGGSHALQERAVREEVAANNLQNNSELLLLQIEKSWQDLSDSYKQYRLSEEAKTQAERNLQLTEDSYKNGIVKLSDLLEAQALLQQTLDQLTDSKAAYANKVSGYLQVTGR